MIFIVTAVHNRVNITRKFIEGLKKQKSTENIFLVLVDDGSTDDTDQMVKQEYPNSYVIYGNGKLFWGGALHKAYKYLHNLPINDEDIVLYANDDAVLPNDFIIKVQNLLKIYPNELITGCGYSNITSKYLDGPIDFDLKTSAVRLLPPGVNNGNCSSTRALAMYGKTFKDIGGFHPVLLPHYGSDYEYTIRAWKKGHKIISSQELKYYFNETTTGNNSYKNLTLKKLISKKSKLNPFYKLIFLILVGPVHCLPSYVLYQIKHLKKQVLHGKLRDEE